MTSTAVVCIIVSFSQSRTSTRLNQMLTNIFLPEMQQYEVTSSVLQRKNNQGSQV